MKISSAPFLLVLACLLAGAGAAACSSARDGGGPGPDDCSGILAGDLVITEVMANPAGTDDGKEYFEIYGAGSAPLDLAGLTLAYGPPDGSSEETHQVDGLSIAASDYVTLGTSDPDALPDFVDYGFGSDLGVLRNAGAVLALRCGDTEVDRTLYPSQEGEDGFAVVLDGASAPDYLANDDAANFCLATTEFAPGMFGSPGAANQPCAPVPVATCLDGGVERNSIAPEIGDLVITEFMASPAGPDDTGEWFEVAASRDVDLNGLVAGREPGGPSPLVAGEGCVRLAAGEYALFARASSAATNGGLPEITAAFDFSLVGAGSLFIGAGDLVLDRIAWSSAEEGVSTALDPDSIDPAGNDDPAAWIPCGAPYGDGAGGNTGTPGAGNEACAVSRPADGTCLEGGRARPIVSPAAGQIRITEAFANPITSGEDSNQEWFEVRALADFDLNGLGFNEDDGDDVLLTIDDPACRPVSRGDLILFARSGDPAVNGGLPDVDQTFDFSLNDSNGRLFASLDGEILDALPYGTATAGRSRQVDASGALCNTLAGPYDPAGDRGTPAAANPPCS